ncbi:hypothetical protein RF11_13440 [Thelohanellus kitauei]|uniref:Uncharacterized protein n=1 Tax=Thelohanellus kitauei TaxID=669202 RepID=A0A0C2N6F4_THEKT|nr:hypothetical protein RF11_13440 [Thelohanellus kitauei]
MLKLAHLRYEQKFIQNIDQIDFFCISMLTHVITNVIWHVDRDIYVIDRFFKFCFKMNELRESQTFFPIMRGPYVFVGHYELYSAFIAYLYIVGRHSSELTKFYSFVINTSGNKSQHHLRLFLKTIKSVYRI